MNSNKVILRPVVIWFAEQMELALRRNDHKGGWENMNDSYLMNCMQEEKQELSSALHFKHPIESIVSEAADVANFALMIADNAQRASEPTE